MLDLSKLPQTPVENREIVTKELVLMGKPTGVQVSFRNMPELYPSLLESVSLKLREEYLKSRNEATEKRVDEEVALAQIGFKANAEVLSRYYLTGITEIAGFDGKPLNQNREAFNEVLLGVEAIHDAIYKMVRHSVVLSLDDIERAILKKQCDTSST